MFEQCRNVFWRWMARFDKGGCDHVWRIDSRKCLKCNMPWQNRLRQNR